MLKRVHSRGVTELRAVIGTLPCVDPYPQAELPYEQSVQVHTIECRTGEAKRSHVLTQTMDGPYHGDPTMVNVFYYLYFDVYNKEGDSK